VFREQKWFGRFDEPIQIEETSASKYVDVLGRRACHLEVQGPDLSAKPNSRYLSLQKEISLNSLVISPNSLVLSMELIMGLGILDT
jgi:hypothetical protein